MHQLNLKNKRDVFVSPYDLQSRYVYVACCDIFFLFFKCIDMSYVACFDIVS